MNLRYAHALIIALALGCAGERDAGPGADVDAAAAPPPRVVSLIPSVTETIVAIGGADQLVGRTSVGQGLTPNLERLALLEPDLVVAWPDNSSRSVVARLLELGVDVYTPEVQSIADIERVARELGDRLGREAAADSLVNHIDARLARLRRSLADESRPSVFYVVSVDPPITAGPGTFISELIAIAGGRNAFDDLSLRWPQVSLEEVVRRQPDFVLLSRGERRLANLERLREAVGWRDLEAVDAGRVIEVDADLFNRPGPRLADAARRLAAALHPRAFEEHRQP